MRVAIYLRISQDRTGEELGVTRQREACEELAARRGWTVHDVYIDNDVSAAGGKVRTQWEAMMAAIEAGLVEVVIGWTIDRTLRTGRDRLRMLEVGKARGLTISLVRGSDMDLSTPAGRLAADILGAVALNEIEVKSDRQKAAHAQAARMGRRYGGRRPFGYEQDGITLRLAEAEEVVKAYDDYLAGTPILAIARRWNKAGLLSGVTNPQTGKPTQWDHSGVRAVLRNARYAGFRVHNGEIVAKATWPALVSESTYRAVVALLDSSAAEFKPRGGKRLLTGIALCGVCDQPVNAGGNKRGSPPCYRCPTGGHVTRRAQQVEDQVEHVVVHLLNDRQFQAAFAAAAASAQEPGENLAATAADLREEMDTIARERMQRIITPRQFTVMNAELMAKLDDVERRMATAEHPSGVQQYAAHGITAAQWNALGVDRQRPLVAATVKVRIHSGGRGVRKPPPETVEIKPRY